MYRKDLALNNLQWLIWYKTQPTQENKDSALFIEGSLSIFFFIGCVCFRKSQNNTKTRQISRAGQLHIIPYNHKLEAYKSESASLWFV